MPVIQIKSLPFQSQPNMEHWLTQLSREFSQQTGIDTKHISIGWLYYDRGHYLDDSEIADFQSQNSHPLMVELLVPDFNKASDIQHMIRVAAHSLSDICNIDINNIFVHAATAANGLVFDKGSIVSW
ncbi:MAG: hypothetical protein OQL09_08865 [Gammaproteobacteria bacterium]|nr:hypothetical protein [Gammaproteobacteria bacterium]